MKNISKRFILVGIVPILLMASMLNILASSPAYAADDPVDKVRKQVSRHLLGRALFSCLYNNDDSNFNEDDARDGRWDFGLFLDNDPKANISGARITVGPYRADNSPQYCDDYNGTGNSGAFVKPALEALGLTEGNRTIDFLCDLKGTDGDVTERDDAPSDGSAYQKCRQATGDFNDLPGGVTWESFKNSVYAHSGLARDEIPLDDLNEIQRYYLAYWSVTRLCGATETDEPATRDDVIVIDKVEANGDIKPDVKVKLSVGDKRGKDVAEHPVNLYMLRSGSKDPYTRQCQQFSSNESLSDKSLSTGALSKAFSDYLKSFYQSTGTTPPPAGTDLTTPGGTGSGGSDEPQCSTGDAGGWIACIAFTGMRGAIENLVKAFVEPLLKVDTFIIGNANRDTIYNIWNNFRNLANIALIFAFIAVIYSQATSSGINSYGIKRTLPRIVVAAILINLSFFVTGVMVDLSNIFGNGMGAVLASGLSGGTISISNASSGSLLSLGAGGILAGVFVAGGIGAALWAILPVVAGALLALLVFALVLIARLALVNLLVILAPLAIAAMILPNTESWFKKWRSTFGQMLMLYPIIMLVLASGTLVSIIVDSAGEGILFDALALFAQFLPIFALPLILKSFGGILNKAGDALNRVSGAAAGGIRNYSKDRKNLAKEKYLAGESRPGIFGASRRFSQRRNSARINREDELKAAQQENRNRRDRIAAGLGDSSIQGRDGNPSRLGRRLENKSANARVASELAAKNTKTAQAALETANNRDALTAGSALHAADNEFRFQEQTAQTSKTALENAYKVRQATPGDAAHGLHRESQFQAQIGKNLDELAGNQWDEHVADRSSAAHSVAMETHEIGTERKMHQANLKADALQHEALDPGVVIQTKTAERQAAQAESMIETAFNTEVAANGSAANIADTGARQAELDVKHSQATVEANWSEHVATNPVASLVDQQTRAEGIRKQVADNVLVEQFANEVGVAGSPLNVQAGGNVRPAEGQVRAAAIGVSASVKIRSEALQNQVLLLGNEQRESGVDEKTFLEKIITDVEAGNHASDFTVNGTTHTVQHSEGIIQATLERAAATGSIGLLEVARGSSNFDQSVVSSAITNNDGTVKGKGGYHLATDFDITPDHWQESKAYQLVEQRSRAVSAPNPLGSVQATIDFAKIHTAAQSSAQDISNWKAGAVKSLAQAIKTPGVKAALTQDEVDNLKRTIMEAVTSDTYRGALTEKIPSLEELFDEL